MLDSIINDIKDFAIAFDNLPESEQKRTRNEAYQRYGTFALVLFKAHGDTVLDPTESVVSEYGKMQQGLSDTEPKWVTHNESWSTFHYYKADADRSAQVAKSAGFLGATVRPFEDTDREAWVEEQWRFGRVLSNEQKIEAGSDMLIDGWPWSPTVDTHVAHIKRLTSVNAVVRRSK